MMRLDKTRVLAFACAAVLLAALLACGKRETPAPGQLDPKPPETPSAAATAPRAAATAPRAADTTAAPETAEPVSDPTAPVFDETAAVAGAQAGIYLFPPMFDFGTATAGQVLNVRVEIQRPISQPLTIGRLYCSCPCVAVSAPALAVNAFEPAYVDIRVDTTTLKGDKRDVVMIQIKDPAPVVLRFNIILNVDDQE